MLRSWTSERLKCMRMNNANVWRGKLASERYMWKLNATNYYMLRWTATNKRGRTDCCTNMLFPQSISSPSCMAINIINAHAANYLKWISVCRSLSHNRLSVVSLPVSSWNLLPPQFDNFVHKTAAKRWQTFFGRRQAHEHETHAMQVFEAARNLFRWRSQIFCV